MNQNIESILKEIGLNDTEIKCYLGLLRFGTTNASALSKRLVIPRSTTRHTLEQLAKKELAILSRKNGTFYFIPEEPERIVRLIKREQESLAKKHERATSIIGELQAMMNPQIALPKVEFFEGKASVKKQYLALIKQVPKDSELLSFYIPVPKVCRSEFEDVIEGFDQYQSQKNISMKILAQNCAESRNNAANDTTRSEYKFCPELPLPLQGFAGEIILTPEGMHAFAIDQNGLFAFAIHHGPLVAVYRHLFLMAWNSL